jgi:type III restriction enzyme
MEIKFDKTLEYQGDAINSIVDVFAGQEICKSNFTVYSPQFLASQSSLVMNETGFGNKLDLTEAKVLENVQTIQLRNGLKPSISSDIDKVFYDFSIEMETGTGKTYVYLRSIMEMNRKYGFSKFIIVVPSVPIKEGAYKTLQMTEKHFKENYDNVDYSYFVYNSANLNEIRDFATNDKLQIMVINIQAFNKDLEADSKKANRILLDYNDKLGYTPISLLQNTRPILIVDEPQSTIGTALALRSVKNLNPLALFRFSATHKEGEKYNLLYKLDAIDAYEQQLVKQIEVASVKVENSAVSSAYIRLLSVSNKKGIVAKIELDVKDTSGKSKRVTKEVTQSKDLAQLSKLPQYANYFIKNIYTGEGNEYIELGDDTILKIGEAIGSVDDTAIKRMQIHKTIEEHLNKELVLNPQGIKVLSLFFIDSVKHYRIYDEDGNPSNGDYAKMFEEEYKKLIKKPAYQSLFKEIQDLDSEASEIHNGYFSMDKRPKKSNTKEKYEAFKDTTGTIAADDDTYKLIMSEKEKLLGFGSKLRFIFSHSALKEGWDNPNVFQICTLKEAGNSEIRRRQEIGRGLRIAVNQDGDRVHGFAINKLTVMASESYEDFVDGLQKEMEKETGIIFGQLKSNSFNDVVIKMSGDEPVFLGQSKSEEIYKHLVHKQYISATGKVQDKLREDLKAGRVELGQEFEPEVFKQIINSLKQTAGKLDIKRNEEKKPLKIKEAVLDHPDFKKLWDRIKYKTTYSVEFDSQKLIDACIKHINDDGRLILSGGRLVYNKVYLDVTKGGLISNIPKDGNSIERVEEEVSFLPDIVTYLQNETQLTRKSIVKILQGVTNIAYFKINPQKYIEGCIDIINEQMRLNIVDGIVYRKIGESSIHSQELFRTEELTGYLKSNMVKSTKSPYDYVIYDSGIESQLATEFEKNANVKIYAKLPNWFKIETPLGNYNPDWAVLFEIDGEEQLYFVVESKGSMGYEAKRPSEQGKIDCGKAHFKELAKASSSRIELHCVSILEEFINIAMAKKV